jgi:DSF synthase
MDTYCDNKLSLNLPSYTQLICQYDSERSALWYYLNPRPRPCFTPTLVAEIRDLQQRVADHLRVSPDDVHYFIMASATPQIFSLGGDLELFVRLITERDRDQLYEHGRACIDGIYHNTTNLGIPTLTTISLVQGSALGGGFEVPLSSNVLIAEQRAQMGFPEILFNLFPGMGAYSLLARRIEPARAERLLRTGQQHDARKLWEMGIVDVLAPDGEGVHAVNDFIRRHSRSRNGQQAIQQVRQRVNPLTYQELLDIVEIWADAALRLTARDLRFMTRIAAAQERLDAAGDETAARHPGYNGAVPAIVPATATG